MARAISQTIPGEFYPSYIMKLQPATLFGAAAKYSQTKYGQVKYNQSGRSYVRRRYPFRLPTMQGL